MSKPTKKESRIPKKLHMPEADATAVTMYGATWCGDCRRAQAVLNKLSVEFKYETEGDGRAVERGTQAYSNSRQRRSVQLGFTVDACTPRTLTQGRWRSAARSASLRSQRPRPPARRLPWRP